MLEIQKIFKENIMSTSCQNTFKITKTDLIKHRKEEQTNEIPSSTYRY